METIQQELREPSHYLSMRKRENAANLIDKLQSALNQYSEDDLLLTNQSTIAAQVKQIEALNQVIVDQSAFIAHILGILGADQDSRLCKKCGGIMRPGIAMGQTFSAGTPDFPGEDSCITMSPGGPGRVVDCMKCESCGWSRT